MTDLKWYCSFSNCSWHYQKLQSSKANNVSLILLTGRENKDIEQQSSPSDPGSVNTAISFQARRLTNTYYTHVNVWESMSKPCSCTRLIKSCIFHCKSHENPYQHYNSYKNSYQVLQVVHCVRTCNEIFITIVPSYANKYHSFVAISTDGNKHMIFSGIAFCTVLIFI